MTKKTTNPTRRNFLGASIGAGAAMTMASSANGSEQLHNRRSFQQRIHVDLSLSGLRRIAVDADGNVAIAAGNSVEMRDPTGTFLSEIAMERPARCVATRGNELVVGVRDHVRVFSQDGRLQHWLPTIGRGHLVGDVAIVGDAVMVTDITARSVKRFCQSGKWETIANRKTGFSLPAGGRLVSMRNGLVAMTNPGRHRIEVLSERGETISQWGKRSRDENGFQGCCNPLAAVTLQDGTTVTAEAGQVRLKQFDARGGLVQQIAGPESFSVPAVVSGSDESVGPQLPCAVGGLDLAVSSDDTVWMLHVAAKQLIGWRAVTRA